MSSGMTRKKGQSGRATAVQCVQCGKMIPRDKAVEKRKSVLPMGHRLRELLKRRAPTLAVEGASSTIVSPVLNTGSTFKKQA